MVESTGCSHRVPRLDSQHPHGNSQVSVTPGTPVPSFGLCQHRVCMQFTDVHPGKMHPSIKKKKKRILSDSMGKDILESAESEVETVQVFLSFSLPYTDCRVCIFTSTIKIEQCMNVSALEIYQELRTAFLLHGILMPLTYLTKAHNLKESRSLAQTVFVQHRDR